MRVPLILATFVIAARAGADGAATPPNTQPAVFFRAARDAWHAKPLPPYITYSLDGTFTFGHRVRTFTETVLYRTRDRQAFERRSVNGGPPDLRFGEASFSPDLTFGVAPRSAEHATLVSPDAGSDLPTIGRIELTAIPYTITDAGSDTVDGVGCRRIHLEPHGDPVAHPLRDVCIDPGTLDVVDVHAVTRATKGPFSKIIPFDVTFHEVGPFWMVDRLHVTGRVQVLFASVSGAGTITVTKINYPAMIPDYYFTRAAYDAHPAERAADGFDSP